MIKKWLFNTILVLLFFTNCMAMYNKNVDTASVKGFEQRGYLCSICLNEIVGVMTKLPCGHKFCESCINRWRLTQKNACCPMCRAKIPTLVVDFKNEGGATAPDALPEHINFQHTIHAVNNVLAYVVPTGDAIQNFMISLLSHNWPRAQELFDDGVDIHCENDFPINAAVQNNDFCMMRWLIEHGIDVNFDNNLLMRVALDQGDWYMVRWLIMRGGDVHFDNNRPMRVAIEACNWPMVRCLIAHGADVHLDGEAAMRRALVDSARDDEILNYLSAQGGWRTNLVWFCHDIRHDPETQLVVGALAGLTAMAGITVAVMYDKLRRR